jgi:hypothetical protein
MLFSDFGEWWDKAEIKHIIIEYSKAVRQQINEQRSSPSDEQVPSSIGENKFVTSRIRTVAACSVRFM